VQQEGWGGKGSGQSLHSSRHLQKGHTSFYLAQLMAPPASYPSPSSPQAPTQEAAATKPAGALGSARHPL
jgi:hypothetical protein